MRNKFTTKFLAVLTGCLMSMGAWAADVTPTEILDVRATLDDQTAMDAAGWASKNQTINYFITGDTIVFNAYLCYQSATKQLWTGSVGAGSSSGAWNSIGVFPGSTEWGITNYPTTRDSRTYTFQVTNCLGASVCLNTKGKGTQTMAAYEIVGGTVSSTVAASADYAANALGVATISGLDPKKAYYIKVNSNNSSNSNFYEIAFVAAPATPSIKAFTAAGVEATISNDTISAELPFGTNLAAITPTVTLGGSATSYTPTGAVDFTNSSIAGSAVDYTATDGTLNTVYKVILTAATTASSEKDLTNVTIGGMDIELNGTTGNLVVSKATDLTALAVTFDIPATATANFTSGNTYDFTSPLAITVTAQDNSTETYTLTVTKGTKDILYLSTSTATDLFFNQLVEKGYYVNKRAGMATAPANYDGIDLVVLHESLSGGDGAGTEKELALIKNVDVPILNTKSYFYSAGSSPRWGWGTPTNGNGNDTTSVMLDTVYTNITSHPIFAGITLNNGGIQILATKTSKNIQPVASFEAGFEGYNLATVPAGCAIHELPAADRLASGTSKYLLISILSTKFNDLTTDGLKLLDNACNYLMGETAWIPSTTPTSVNNTTLTGVSYANGIIVNANQVRLNVYNVTGKLVATSMSNIDMNEFSNGMYIVRGQEGSLKIVK